MRRPVIFFFTLFVSACERNEPDGAAATQVADEAELQKEYAAWANSQPRPSREIVDRIEVALSRHPCIGDLSRWERTYSYDGEGMTVRYDHIVAFRLREAGRFGIRPGQRITEPYSWASIDDTPVKIAWGDYDMTDDEVRIGFCVLNVGSNADVEPIKSYFDDLDRRRLLRPGKPAQ